jgi:UDP-glucose 4-epimerase
VKVLVTGGAGFIGSHITDTLIEMGAEVAVVDNLATGFIGNVNKKAVFYRVGVETEELDGVFAGFRPDHVFHEAAQTDIQKSVLNPVYDARVNILGGINVMTGCLKYGVKKLVYASSCAVFGEPQYLPIDEDHPVNPKSQYGASKHTLEHYLNIEHNLYGLKYIALRYSNIYGPRQNTESGVIAIFSAKMLAGQPTVIFGPGDNCRDYVYVGDCVKANLLAMESAKNGIYNIGTGRATTDREVWDVTSHEFEYKLPINFGARRPGDIRKMYMDASKARNELGWVPQVSFEEGVAKTARFYRSREAVKS